MGKGIEYDFENYQPDFERVVEIYNAWGSSECTKKEGNNYPIESQNKKGMRESAEGSIQKALQRNCRFGFVAGSDDRGIYADLYDIDQQQYSPGFTAIIAHEHTRSALIEALYNRSCYATTGQRIIIGLTLASMGMGSEISTVQKHGLLYNRHFEGFVAGTTDLTCVELIRNGKVLNTFKTTGYALDFTYDDMINLDKVVINAKDGKPPFAYYYLRVTQADGHMAWSSPIWVDYVPGSATGKSTVKRAAAKPIKPVAMDIEEIEDEEDEDDLYQRAIAYVGISTYIAVSHYFFLFVALLLLAAGWVLTGRSRIQPGACSRNPSKRNNEDCGKDVSCQLCQHPDEAKSNPTGSSNEDLR